MRSKKTSFSNNDSFNKSGIDPLPGSITKEVTMAKCFITGVDLPIHEAYILDRMAANWALKDIREQLATLERLIENLGSMDDAEVFDVKKRETIIRHDRRLVTFAVAEALSAAYPKTKLFMPWKEWHLRRPNMNNRKVSQASISDQNQPDAIGGQNDEPNS
jgi:hypothetical protein